jgi:hypothetical protein
MVELSIEDFSYPDFVTKQNITHYIEKRLLPTINAQSADNAHNIIFTLHSLLQDEHSTEIDKAFSQAVLRNVQDLGIDLFRIHPKVLPY